MSSKAAKSERFGCCKGFDWQDAAGLIARLPRDERVAADWLQTRIAISCGGFLALQSLVDKGFET